MNRKTIARLSMMTLVLLSFYVFRVSAQVKGSAGNLNNCVVKITTPDETGAGIVIGTRDGEIFILTAYHVVKDAQKIKVALFNKRYAESPADAIRSNLELDVAVIRISGSDQFPTVQWRKDLRLREKVMIIGHPADEDWQFALEQIVRLDSQDDSRKFLYSSPTVQKGFSGGPVFDENSALLGMALGHGASGLAIAVTSDSLVNLLENWGIPKSYLNAAGVQGGDTGRGQRPRVQESTSLSKNLVGRWKSDSKGSGSVIIYSTFTQDGTAVLSAVGKFNLIEKYVFDGVTLKTEVISGPEADSETKIGDIDVYTVKFDDVDTMTWTHTSGIILVWRREH